MTDSKLKEEFYKKIDKLLEEKRLDIGNPHDVGYFSGVNDVKKELDMLQ